MQQNFLKNFPPKFQKIIFDLYNLILERSLMRAYNNLSEEKKVMMAKIFNSDNEEEKDKFLNEYLKNWQDIIIEETKKIMMNIKKTIS